MSTQNSQIILQGITLDDLLRELTNRLKPVIDDRISTAIGQKTTAEEYIGRNDVAAILKISLTTVAEHCRQGKLKPHRIGRRVLFKRSEVLETIKPAQYGRS